MKKGHFILAIVFFLLSVVFSFYFFDYIDFPGLSLIPYYAAASFLRMSLAYFFALCFALSYGYVAATNKRARSFMLPFLDILQSIPILGFFPAAVLFFISHIHGRPGVEMAAIFLIFTSMAWNLAFGVYESLTTIPKEIVEAANSFGLRGWQRLEKLTIPACVPKLVYNSIISWSAGWFFLVASEIISAGSESYKLPGIGSFLIESTYSGKIALMLVGLSVLIIIILLLELFIWKPMQSWADRFNYDYRGEKKPGEFIFNTRIIKRSFHFIFKVFSRVTVSLYIIFHKNKIFETATKYSGYLAMATAIGYILYILLGSVVKVFLDLPPGAYSIPLAIVYSFLRLGAAYIICILWTIPVAVYIARNKKASSYLMPIMEITASIPAIALFPAVVVIFMRYGNLELASIILVLLGMQWYLLFNLIAGVKSISNDMENVAYHMGSKENFTGRRSSFLPCSLRSLPAASLHGEEDGIP